MVQTNFRRSVIQKILQVPIIDRISKAYCFSQHTERLNFYLFTTKVSVQLSRDVSQKVLKAVTRGKKLARNYSQGGRDRILYHAGGGRGNIRNSPKAAPPQDVIENHFRTVHCWRGHPSTETDNLQGARAVAVPPLPGKYSPGAGQGGHGKIYLSEEIQPPISERPDRISCSHPSSVQI